MDPYKNTPNPQQYPNQQPTYPQPQQQPYTGHQQIPPAQVQYQPVQPVAGAPIESPATPNVIPVAPVNPDMQMISPEIEAKHRDSVARYPEIRLSAGEYVIETVRRHPIGMVSIWAFVGLIVIIMLAIIPTYAINLEWLAHSVKVPVENMPSPLVIAAPALFVAVLAALGGLVSTYVYLGNRFYLTNESVIQHVKTSLFNNKTQVINLINVEDVSSEQNGIIQQLFGYGTIRLSTQGEETIYHFYYVANPQKVVNDINDTVEISMHKMGGNKHHLTH